MWSLSPTCLDLLLRGLLLLLRYASVILHFEMDTILIRDQFQAHARKASSRIGWHLLVLDLSKEFLVCG